MSNAVLVHATGLCALALNLVALVCNCERRLRVRSGIAGMVWALNNFLLGANGAAALSVVSAGRTATSAVTLHGAGLQRRVAFGGFCLLTLAIGVLTWVDWTSTLILAASLISTYAVFHLTGRSLRWVMLAVSAMWMVNAWSYGSWEQMAANVLSATASLIGACRVGRAAEPVAA